MMNKTQIGITLGGVILVFLLYQLPRVVVENEEEASVGSDDHFAVSTSDAAAITSLKSKITLANSENFANFADSLAGYFLKYGFTDSAVQIVDRILVKDSSLTALKISSERMYSAFERNVDATQTSALANKAGKLLEKWLIANPQDVESRVKLAMTKVSSENPMDGIMMLREVLEGDPENRSALINMGVLAMRSGQYERAIERFEKLVSMDSNDYESILYWGISLVELGQKDAAKEKLELIVGTSKADISVKAAADEYLKNL